MSADDEMSQNLTPGERELSDALAQLRPLRGGGLDETVIAFDAGHRSARRSLAAWRGVAVLLLLALSASVLTRFDDPAPPTQVADGPAAPAARERSVDTQLAAYYALRNDVIERGVAALPAPAGGSTALPIRIRGGVAGGGANDKL